MSLAMALSPVNNMRPRYARCHGPRCAFPLLFQASTFWAQQFVWWGAPLLLRRSQPLHSAWATDGDPDRGPVQLPSGVEGMIMSAMFPSPATGTSGEEHPPEA
jgi:hypothetical protein